MNPSIKRRQTLLVNWLQKVVNCTVTTAESGSQYVTLNTCYTGKTTIRISDHLSCKSDYIHVVLSALNDQVIINYKNFVWSGVFSIAKHVLYAFAMGRTMLELNIADTSDLDASKTVTNDQKETFKKLVINWKKDTQIELKHYFLNKPAFADEIIQFMAKYGTKPKAAKSARWAEFKKQMNFIAQSDKSYF